jgi:shikimate kinase
MQNHFKRLLQNQQQVDHFLHSVLNIDNAQLDEKIEYRIITAEKGSIDGLNEPTSTSLEYRDMKYRTTKQRLALRKQIVDELFNIDQLEKDDDIKLGTGGAKPIATKATQDAFILTGLPASGKSSVATKIANEFGAYILDSDFAKRKLPEYAGYPWGASIVHAESRDIIFRDEGKSFQCLFSKVLEAQQNLIIPTIGGTPDDVIEYTKLLKQVGYKVHLTLTYLSKEKATTRALKRFSDTDRYVPLSLIFDVYSENPALTYFLLRTKAHDLFNSFGIVNTDVPKSDVPFCTDFVGENPAKLYKINTKSII